MDEKEKSPLAGGQLQKTISIKTNTSNIQQKTEKVKIVGIETPEAAERLADVDPAKLFNYDVLRNRPRPVIYDGWIVKGGFNFIYGDAGSGKSYLVAAATLKLARENPDDMVVYYIDLDNPENMPEDRGITPYVDRKGIKNFFYVNTAYNDDIKKTIAEKGLSQSRIKHKILQYAYFFRQLEAKSNRQIVLVFDSLQNFANTNETDEIKTIFSELKENLKDRMTYIFIHHVNKAGIFKGLTLLRDISDSFYYVDKKLTEKEGVGYFTSQTIKFDKMRYFTQERVTYSYDPSERLEYELTNFSLSNQEKAVLRIAVKELVRTKELTQKELLDRITSRLDKVGRNKIFAIIKNYESVVFFIDKGDKHTMLYRLNTNSEIVKYLMKNPLEGKKRKLYDYARSAVMADEELTEPIRIGGKAYMNYQAILDDIYRINEREAIIILNTLEKDTVDIEDDESPDRPPNKSNAEPITENTEQIAEEDTGQANTELVSDLLDTRLEYHL